MNKLLDPEFWNSRPGLLDEVARQQIRDFPDGTASDWLRKAKRDESKYNACIVRKDKIMASVYRSFADTAFRAYQLMS